MLEVSCLPSRYFEQYQSTHAGPPGVARASFSKALSSQDVEPGLHGLLKYAWHHCFGPAGAALADGRGADDDDGRTSLAPVMGDADARADPVTSSLGADGEAVFTGGTPNAT